MAVLMSLGSFKFEISTAAYSELRRANAWRWSGQARIGLHDRLQYVGRDNETITLIGTVYPGIRGAGVGQLERLREIGNSGEPQLLVSGEGDVMGYWVLESEDSSESRFVRGGAPRKQTFSLAIKFYGDDLHNP